jgi:enoyl-CoA hydratase/carnithine racemase
VEIRIQEESPEARSTSSDEVAEDYALLESDDQTVKVERHEHKFIITLNRPKVLNALNLSLLNHLGDAILEFEADKKSLVAVLKGSDGRAFSSGADLKDKAASDAVEAPRYYPIDGLPRGFAELERCSKPIVAAIAGYCLAGGLELSLLCDIRVAARSAVFGLPEVRWGLIPNGGLHDLSRMIPMGEAKMLQLTGGRMNAERAFAIGLIQQLEEDWASAVRSAEAIADEIALGAPLAVRACKEIVRTAWHAAPDEARKSTASIAERIEESEDRLEGVRSFSEGRVPLWKGR